MRDIEVIGSSTFLKIFSLRASEFLKQVCEDLGQKQPRQGEVLLHSAS